MYVIVVTPAETKDNDDLSVRSPYKWYACYVALAEQVPTFDSSATNTDSLLHEYLQWNHVCLKCHFIIGLDYAMKQNK